MLIAPLSFAIVVRRPLRANPLTGDLATNGLGDADQRGIDLRGGDKGRFVVVRGPRPDGRRIILLHGRSFRAVRRYHCPPDSCITLFRAKRDAPLSRRRKGTAIWAEAPARFDAAEAAFQLADDAFRDAERTYFAARGGTLSEKDDKAIVEQKRHGDARHETAMALLHTPAPELAAVIRKLERVRDDGDDHATVSILADVRWIMARSDSCEKRP